MLRWACNHVLRSDRLFDRRRVLLWGAVLLVVQCLALGFVAAGTYGLVVKLDRPASTDFVSFYAAGSLADAGRPAAAYDRAEHHAAEQRATADGIEYNYFYYPPVFLLVCAPLAKLPYLAAFAVFEAATLALLAWAALRIVGERRWAALVPMLAFPAVVWNLGMGQNAFLSAGLFAAATLLLDGGRPVLAGLLFGALCFKPHLGLLIPFALAGGGWWRAVAGAAGAVALLVLGSVLAFGLHAWEAFFSAFAGSPELYQSGRVGFELMVSVLGAARLLGLPPGTSYVLQGVATCAMAALVFASWRRGSPADLPARCAVLLSATLLAVPLALFYDLMLLGVAMAWLVRAGRTGSFLPGEAPLLAAVTVLVFLAPLATGLAHLPFGLMAAVLVLGLALRRLWVRQDRTAWPRHGAGRAVLAPLAGRS